MSVTRHAQPVTDGARTLGAIQPDTMPGAVRVKDPMGRALFGTPFCHMTRTELRAWGLAFIAFAEGRSVSDHEQLGL